MCRAVLLLLVTTATAHADPEPPSPLEFGLGIGPQRTDLKSADGGMHSTGVYFAADVDYHISPSFSLAAVGAYASISGNLCGTLYHIDIQNGGSQTFLGAAARWWPVQSAFAGLTVGSTWTSSGNMSQRGLFFGPELGTVVFVNERMALRVSAGIDLFTFDDVSYTTWIAVGGVVR
jgi:hypothetical protein